MSSFHVLSKLRVMELTLRWDTCGKYGEACVINDSKLGNQKIFQALEGMIMLENLIR